MIKKAAKNKETLSTLNTRTGVKSYSSYWLDFDDYTPSKNVVEVLESADPERIIKLSSVRRAVANFVRILTNDEKINVEFSSGKQSYTDGKRVVIAADADPKSFDSMVGLALHEGAHCLLSDFNFLRVINKNWAMPILCYKQSLRDIVLPKEYDDAGIASMQSKARAITGIILNIMNVIEDRRIDSYVYKNAVGYRPYYDALYEKYFFNKDVAKNLKFNPEWRTPNVENYVNWLINIFHSDFDRNALPGLDKMVDMIDLNNIRRFDITQRMPDHESKWKFTKTNTPWFGQSLAVARYDDTYYTLNGNTQLVDYDSLPLLWKTANDIVELIIKYAASYEQEMSGKNGEGDQPITINLDGVEFEVGDGMELPNLDMGGQQVIIKNGKFSDKKGKDAMKKMKQVMNGKNSRKKLSAKEKQDMENMETADAKMVDGGDKIIGNFPCLVLRKVNKSVMQSSVFPFAHVYEEKNEKVFNKHNEGAIVSGMRMGQILANRLQVRNDPQITHFTRQPHGKIDRRILSQLGMDIESVFKRTTVDTYKPVLIHLSLDASGSMGGKKFAKCITVATAMAYVASKISNIDVVITLRGDNTVPVVAVVYDSRVDNFQKVRSLFPSFYAHGSTPEGLCFKATMDLITEAQGKYDMYFINFSDGEPGSSIRHKGEYKNYAGKLAEEHTRRQVHMMREAGVKILSYFITDMPTHKHNLSQIAFKNMYGENASFVNVENVTDVLRTMNKLLLSKGA